MLLPIVTNPSPVLRKKTKSVRTVTSDIRELISNMAETMYSASGVGLAAPQVGKLLKLVVIDISQERNELIVLINPKIVYKSKEKDVLKEGCLSVPGYEGQVERHLTIRVKTMNHPEFEAKGFFARVIQHELDHLNGNLYIDNLFGDSELCRLEPKKTT